MKLFFVDQFNKVQEFNGTDEEKNQLAYAYNLYLTEYDAYEATHGRKVRYNPSIFTGDMLEKWTINRSFRPVQVRCMSHLEDLCRDSFRRMRKQGLLFDTFEEAEAMSKKIIAFLRGEESSRASYQMQTQDGLHPLHTSCASRESLQSQGRSSCGCRKRNSVEECRELGRQNHQGRMTTLCLTIVL